MTPPVAVSPPAALRSGIHDGGGSLPSPRSATTTLLHGETHSAARVRGGQSDLAVQPPGAAYGVTVPKQPAGPEQDGRPSEKQKTANERSPVGGGNLPRRQAEDAADRD